MSKSISHAPTVVIDDIYPSLEGGRYPVKRVVNEPLTVFADIFKDGHDVITAVVKWRKSGSRKWFESPLAPLDNDRWTGECAFSTAGRWEFVIEAWPDSYRAWKKAFLARWKGADPEIAIEALEGARLLTESAVRARATGSAEAATKIEDTATKLKSLPPAEVMDLLQSAELQGLLDQQHDRALATQSRSTWVIVERERARFSSWYEFFPRNALGRADKHSTFRDCVARLDDAKDMGFDVIYFPPIHPIGATNRKGKNNTLTTTADDVGSPWAIGGKAGGHKAVEPALGTISDFVWLVEQAKVRGLEIALDFAINCSPDHPYVKDHPDWFYLRPDGSIRYAENPPKKYQDIYPINFHCDDWKNLWSELISIVLFWVEKGVKIFRVDNPHTKPVAFWEELIATVHRADPDVIFLAEAFTQPKMMQVLGKVGFTQSYTYFTWRTNKHEMQAYATELTASDMRWYYRGNFWPNTPDILPHELQNAPAAKFRIRAALAATLSSCWGMYSGYELCEGKPLPGREEYLDSEKFQLFTRDWNAPGNIKAFIRELNRIRQNHPAMHLYDNLRFHRADHDQIIAYSKATPDFRDRLLCIVSFDAEREAASLVHLDLGALGIDGSRSYQVTDLLHGHTYEWKGASNYVALTPNRVFMHLFEVKQ